MLREKIISMIIALALDAGVPPYFALSIAMIESELNPMAININQNGTYDRGIFQLNTSWHDDELWYEPERNIRAGIEHIKMLMAVPELLTLWSVAVSYNCGHIRFLSEQGPPVASIGYARKVMAKYEELSGRDCLIMVPGRK